MLHCFFLARDLARVFCTTCSARLKSVLAAHKSSMGYELYWTGCVDLPICLLFQTLRVIHFCSLTYVSKNHLRCSSMFTCQSSRDNKASLLNDFMIPCFIKIIIFSVNKMWWLCNHPSLLFSHICLPKRHDRVTLPPFLLLIFCKLP